MHLLFSYESCLSFIIDNKTSIFITPSIPSQRILSINYYRNTFETTSPGMTATQFLTLGVFSALLNLKCQDMISWYL